MDRESVDRLRFDQRLQRRRDWLEAGEREGYLEALPDVSEKMTTIAEAEAEADSAPESAGAEPAAAAPFDSGLGGTTSTSVGGGAFGSSVPTPTEEGGGAFGSDDGGQSH